MTGSTADLTYQKRGSSGHRYERMTSTASLTGSAKELREDALEFMAGALF